MKTKLLLALACTALCPLLGSAQTASNSSSGPGTGLVAPGAGTGTPASPNGTPGAATGGGRSSGSTTTTNEPILSPSGTSVGMGVSGSSSSTGR